MNAWNPVESEELVHRAGGVAMIGLVHGVAYNAALRPNPRRFGPTDVDAIVPNQRIGEGQNLTCKRRVRKRFLIPHHAGGEHEFARSNGLSTEELARITPAVSGQKNACSRGRCR